MATDFLLPFGKYKGQRLADVIHVDPDYCEWLKQQSELLARYPAVVKGFSELGISGDQTPLHNAIQALFLDNAVCLRLINVLWGKKLTHKLCEKLLRKLRLERTFDIIGPIGAFNSKGRRRELLQNLAHSRQRIRSLANSLCLGDLELLGRIQESQFRSVIGYMHQSSAQALRAEVTNRLIGERRSFNDGRLKLAEMRARLSLVRADLDLIKVEDMQRTCRQDLRHVEEFNGSDVHFRYTIGATLPGRDVRYPDITRTFDVWLEIKPFVSDDYPSVLRQVDVQRRPAAEKKVHESRFVVIAGRYGGHGATLEQVRQMFSEAGFDFVLLEEVECQIPTIVSSPLETKTLPLFAT